MTAAARRGNDLDVVIVGGGIAGLAAAQRLDKLGETRWLLVESAPDLGGKIRTRRAGGFVVEGGPDCFLAAKPAGIKLCRDLGLEEHLTGTDPRFRKTYVKRDGRLHELPAGITGLVPSRLRPLLTSSILRPLGRARAGLEMLVPAKRSDREESIADFVTRRFGRETYEWLVEPLLSGIFAGDGRKLSLAATFPRLVETEREHGSVVRRMLLSKLRGWLRRGDSASAPPPMGFVTPRNGLGEIVEALVERLPAPRLVTAVAVEALRPCAGRWELALDDGERLSSSAVILATPAYATAQLIEGFAPEPAAELHQIPYVSSATVSVSFPASEIEHPLDGYGYVSPRAEGGPVVACTWTSNKFPARVPEDGILIRFFVGRAGNEEVALGDDAAIQELVRQELREVLAIEREPSRWHIFRWPRALPQYHVGHVDRLARIEEGLAPWPNLLLAGAAYRGVGIPDCIESGWRAAMAARELITRSGVVSELEPGPGSRGEAIASCR